MALLIPALFIGIPLIEIALFIQLGGAIGLFNTLLCIILTALVGTWLLRHQGLSTARRIQESVEAGRPPMRELFDAGCLLVAGALLLTPGFFTDAVGLALFAPPVRERLRQWLLAWMESSGRIVMEGEFQTAQGRKPGEPGVVDGDFKVVDKTDPDRP